MKTKKPVLTVQEKYAEKAIRTDMARVIAITLVLISHVWTYFIPQSLNFLSYFGDTGQNLRVLLTFPLIFPVIMTYFGQIGVCTFFISSGANLTPSTFSLKKKFIRLYPAFILAFFLWNFVQPAPSLITLISYVSLLNGFYGVTYSYLWFIPALFGLYILYPVIQKLAQRKWGIVFLILISFCSMAYTILTYLRTGDLHPFLSATLTAIFPFVLGMITKKVDRRYGVLILLIVVIYLMGANNFFNNLSTILFEVFPPLIAYGIFSISANTFRTRWSDTTYILYLAHPLITALLYRYTGFIGFVILCAPALLLLGWYGTIINDKFTDYLMKKVARGENKGKEIVKKS
jgi:hypothetical protein